MDLCHVDEAGFALTQPTTTTWGAVGSPRYVPYEAPQGRRLNVIGGYFSHGPLQGEFRFDWRASVPTPRARAAGNVPKNTAEPAARHGLTAEEVGTIDSEFFLAFIWQLAGRPAGAAPVWRRVRPLMVVVDNYSVHKSERVRQEQRSLAAADVHLVYLPAYSPELSRIEPHWKVIKYYGLPQRSYTSLGELTKAVEVALAQRAVELRTDRSTSAQLLPGTP